MAIQGTDLLLVNRAGASFYVKQEDLINKVADTDLALVNRAGVSYKLTGANLKAGTFNDDDLFLVNRAGASYRVAGSEVKTIITPPTPTGWEGIGVINNRGHYKLTLNLSSALDPTQPVSINIKIICVQDKGGMGVNITALKSNTVLDNAMYMNDWDSDPSLSQPGPTPGTETYDSPVVVIESGNKSVSFGICLSTFIQVPGYGPVQTQHGMFGNYWDTYASVTQAGVTTPTVQVPAFYPQIYIRSID